MLGVIGGVGYAGAVNLVAETEIACRVMTEIKARCEGKALGDQLHKCAGRRRLLGVHRYGKTARAARDKLGTKLSKLRSTVEGEHAPGYCRTIDKGSVLTADIVDHASPVERVFVQ